MRTHACGVVALVLASCFGAADVAGQAAGPSPEQQAVPQERAPSEQPAATQAAIVRSSPAPAPAVAPFDAEQAKRHQAAWAEYLGMPVELTNLIGMKLVLIPPGEFMMGEGLSETYTRTADELPVHRVRITQPFYLGVYEVTQEQCKRVMGENPSSHEGPQHPVDVVAWLDAVQFCEVLSGLPEEKAAGRTYRLPTEAQWEYTCRAGTTTTYHFGNSAAMFGDDYAWFVLTGIPGLFDRKPETVHAVGLKKPNAWGVYDMHGNVWEWCRDWYDRTYYQSSPVDDPTGPATGYARVYRGGGHYGEASPCRSARRNTGMPDTRRGNLGFRVALDVAAKAEPPKNAK